MPDDLRPASRADLLDALSYGLRFRRGKATTRFNEMSARFAAEALADLLLESNLVIMKKPALKGAAQTEGEREGASEPSSAASRPI